MMRIILFLGLCWGPIRHVNYQIVGFYEGYIVDILGVGI